MSGPTQAAERVWHLTGASLAASLRCRYPEPTEMPKVIEMSTLPMPLIAFWIAIGLFILLDATRRRLSLMGWVLVVLFALAGPIGLALYVFVVRLDRPVPAWSGSP